MAKVVLNPTLQSIEGITEPKKRSTDDLAIKAYAAFSKKKLAIDKKLEEQLAKYRNGKLAEFEKTKLQKLKEAHDQELKFLRIKWEYAKTKEEKAAVEREVQRKKEQQKILENNAEAMKKLKSLASDVTKTTISAATSGINNFLGAYSQYMTGIEARIQGSTKSFKGMTGLISRNLAGSPYVSQTKMLENLNNLIAQGIVYNVEQRAFLQTVSDKMVTTFDALDTNLREIIKIQQADSTAARLGLEAELTQFLNANFGDTSYLNSLFDSIAGALIGTSSQLGRDRSIAFEYNIQKWLGSLSSVGVSESTIQSLAKGINYLGTGDITGLSGNESLQRLLLMGAQQAGIDYSSILTGGLTPADANNLLKGVIQFGQQIASTNNQVVKSQYAQLFGLTISDMTALLNLSSKDLVSISNNMLDYSQAVAETTNQLKQIPSRMTVKDKIDTMFQNVMAGMGETIANTAGAYATWLINEMITQSTGGGIEIPTPFLGPVNINKSIAAGMVGMSALGEVAKIVGGLLGGTLGGLSKDIWNAEDTVRKTRGWGFTGISAKGAARTTSRVQYIGSQDSDTLLSESILGETKETISSSEVAAEESMVKSIDSSENISKILDILKVIDNRLDTWDHRVEVTNLDRTTVFGA